MILTENDILNKIGNGFTLATPKIKVHNLQPFLFNSYNIGEIIFLPYDMVDMVITNNCNTTSSRFKQICRIEEEDSIDIKTKIVSKQGWKSLELDGKNYNYYRMVM